MSRINPSIPITSYQYDHTGAVECILRREIQSWDFAGASPLAWEPILNASIHIATATYFHTAIDIQVHIAKFTFLSILVDDFVIDRASSEEFSYRFFSGIQQVHPLLDHFAMTLRDMRKYYPPFAASAIATSAVQFVDSTVLDEGTPITALDSAALPFVEYKRNKNGEPEAYAFFIFDKFTFPDEKAYIHVIPDCCIFLNYCKKS